MQDAAQPSPDSLQNEAGRPRGFLRWLTAGVRLAVLLPLRGAAPVGTLGHFVAFALLIFAATAARQIVAVGLDGRINPWGIPGALFFVPVLLVASWGFARLAGSAERAPRLAVALAALALPIVVASSIAHWAVDALLANRAAWVWHQRIGWVALAWLALAAAVAAIRLGPIPTAGGRRLAAVAVAAGLLALPLAGLKRTDLVWVAAERPPAADAARRAATEAAIYLQGTLLERELAALAPGRPGVVDLYFVGFGAYAGQDVFMREVRAARALFERRFDAAGRAVSLINNAQTAGETPLATATALERTLAHLGSVMDRDEDVLFLFITSHGARDHRLEVEFRPLPLEPIDPARLRAMLDASGIVWKVVVVSACYSGGFVEALKDDTTVVITAAAPDRNSFGCSNEAEFTYFGKAFLGEALGRTRSFVTAFEQARAAVGVREAAAGFDPSLPQLHVGAAALAQLARLEARLEGTAEAPVGPAGGRVGGETAGRP